MERVWQRQQALSKKVKKEPGCQQSKQKLTGAPDAGKSLSFLFRGQREFAKALGAYNPIFVLGNTFPAKEISAGRATGNRLSQGMIETTLLGKCWHQTIRGGTFGSSSSGVAGVFAVDSTLIADPELISPAGVSRIRCEISSGVSEP